MSRGRSIISLPKSSWETSRKKAIYSVDFWPIKLQEEFKIYHPVQVPALNTSDYFRMNFHNSWTVKYVSKLHKKEKNFDNICFESSKPTVEDHEYVSQDSNNRWNEGQTFWHASGNRCLHKSGKIPASSKAAAAAAATAAAIHHRLHSRKKSFYIKKEILWDRIGDCYFWMTDVQKTLCWYSNLQVRMIRHHGESKRKGVHTIIWQEDSCEVSYEFWRSHTSSIEKKIGKEFMYEDLLHCFHLRSFFFFEKKVWNL